MNNMHEELQNAQDIAIIGMAAHFPGAENIEQFWQNLRNDIESIETYNDEALLAAGVSASALQDPHYIKAGAPLADMEMFDAPFFGFSPKEAMILDPQHRHFLECSWEALEHAGYDPERYENAIGVFGGSGHNAYLPYNLLTNPELLKSVGFFLLRHTGNDKDFLTTRVSYILNLKGPSIAVQTACSTSLVATHMACQSILNGECDMALAGGATIEMPPRHGYLYKEGEILSPDGHCRAFDAKSKGTVFGSGAGVIVLKKLEAAVADGDTVHAIIKSSAVNNDGSMKMGYLAPSVDGQAAAIDEAIAIADIEPDTIGYIETHGTGTPVGDPIEVSALTQAYRIYTDKNQFCAIGSVKTNIGHLDTAAGVAGLIKVTESLKHHQIPASLHYEQPNPSIDFDNSPFFVNNTLTDWTPKDNIPRRAAVNSLGVGGTNAHVILEEAPAQVPSSESRPYQLLCLSARTSTALDKASNNLAKHLQQHPKINLADTAHTLRVGRKKFRQRRILVCQNHEDATASLQTLDPKRVFSTHGSDESPAIAFMFTGQGSQYANMGQELYQQESVYRQTVDRCAQILKPELNFDLRDVLYPSEAEQAHATERLQQTAITQPALFVTEYAIATLWKSWGIEAQAMIGHSIGEYVAACLAGVFTLEDGLKLVATRGRLMESMPSGDMMAVAMPEADLVPLLGERLSLAAINAEGVCVVSGETDAIEALRTSIESDEISCRKLHTSHAFHSAMMDPILAEFTQLVRSITLKAPDKPFVSNLSGTWITAEQATSAEYWAKHLRGTVRFSEGLKCLLEEDQRLLLEVGPGNTLTTFGRQNPAKKPKQTVLNSLRHPKENEPDLVYMLNTLGRLWMAGADIDTKAFEGDEIRYRVPLPTYPFDKQRLWVEPGSASLAIETASASAKLPLDDWFYQPTWQQTSAQLAEPVTLGQLVFFLGENEDELGLQLSELLKNQGYQTITVHRADHYAQLSDDNFQVNPAESNDFERLFETLSKRGALSRVVNLWNITSNDEPLNADKLESGLNRSFYELIPMVQALGKLDMEQTIHLLVLSEGMQQVAGEVLTSPELAPLQGICKVANSEFPSLSCHSIDVQFSKLPTSRRSTVLECLSQEILSDTTDDIVAYRGNHRFIQGFNKLPLRAPQHERIRDGGVYLITGGLGGLGLSLAEHLVTTANAKIALLSRSTLPSRDDWDTWLNTHALNNATSEQIKKIQAIEALGCTPLLLSADVTNLEQMHQAVSKTQAALGKINGVFHTAGVLNDGLISLKDKASLASVLAPKIQGTWVLDQIFTDVDIDFCVLYSSVSSIAGVTGQVDYTAANAFLNAFAHYRQGQGGTPMIAINWGAWQQIGMAANLANNMGIADAHPFNHPFYQSYISMGPNIEEFRVQMSTADQWVLDQHRTKAGIPLVPGTGYLEFARAAYDANCNNIPVEISNVLFMSPFSIKENEEKTLCVKLEYNGQQADFSVLSRGGEGSDSWSEEHVQGSITYLTNALPLQTLDISDIIGRCTKRHENRKGKAEHAHLSFGERWKHIDTIDFGDTEALITMALPEQFSSDFDTFALHPAMLDLATGAAQSLIPGFEPENDFLIPISYSSIKIYAPLEPDIYSHVRYSADPDNADIAYFDVSITDRKGLVLVEINRFVMKQVDHSALAGMDERPTPKPDRQTARHDGTFAETLAAGLLPEEGLAALERALSTQHLPQLIVSPVDFDAYLKASRLTPDNSLDSDQEDEEELDSGVERPEIPTPYVAPASDIEQIIAKVWQHALGINKIGINDNFFELGGHSLLLTQIVARSRKQLKRELPLSDVFELPTIAEWAAILDKDTGEQSSVPDVIAIDRAQYRMTRAALAAVAGY